MTQEIINILHMLINENDPDMRAYYAVAINNYILELEEPKTCEGCTHIPTTPMPNIDPCSSCCDYCLNNYTPKDNQ